MAENGVYIDTLVHAKATTELEEEVKRDFEAKASRPLSEIIESLKAQEEDDDESETDSQT